MHWLPCCGDMVHVPFRACNTWSASILPESPANAACWSFATNRKRQPTFRMQSVPEYSCNVGHLHDILALAIPLGCEYFGLEHSGAHLFTDAYGCWIPTVRMMHSHVVEAPVQSLTVVIMYCSRGLLLPCCSCKSSLLTFNHNPQ